MVHARFTRAGHRGVLRDGTNERRGDGRGTVNESEISALDADVTLLAAEVADLAALMQQVTREIKRLRQAFDPSAAE